MATIQQEANTLHRAVRGAVEGFVYGVIGVGLVRLVRAGGSLDWETVVLPTLIGGLVGAYLAALGRAIARGLVGATLGAVLGMALGGIVGNHLGARYFPDEPEAETPRVEGGAFELAGPTVQGGKYDLREQRGKVVLVDFWATWCGPCVAELPNVLRVYETYHPQGLEIVGVSLDFQKESLLRFIEARKVPWPQIYFDQEGARGWDNPLARQHGIHSIPRMFLIDREGKVIGKDLRGAEVERAVASALGGTSLGLPVFQAGKGGTQGFMLGILAGVLLGPLVGALGQRLLQRNEAQA